MAGPITSYYASVGIDVDKKSLSEVDKFLKRIEEKLKKANGLVKIKFGVNQTHLEKELREALAKAGTKLKLRVGVDIGKGWMGNIQSQLSAKQFRISVVPTVSFGAARQYLRQQQQLFNSGTRTRAPRDTMGRQVRGGSNTNSDGRFNSRREWRTSGDAGGVAANRRASISGRGDPSIGEFLGMGNRTAGNRRFMDAVASQGTAGFGGFAGRAGAQGLLRLSATSLAGRGITAAGISVGGPVGGVVGGAIGAVVSSIIPIYKGVWSASTAIITAPFKLLGGAINTLTSGFYRLAQTLLPFLGAGMLINQNVRGVTSRHVALQTTASRFGSSGAKEGTWLMNVANREGLTYESMIDPFVSFIGAASSSVGLDRSRNVFEAVSQYGSVHGADTVSTGRALLALSQMAGKGTIMSEELKNQLAEAKGYSGMMDIFALAYQEQIGGKLTGQKAMEALLDSMKKGKVLFADIADSAARQMRLRATPGLELARKTSYAEQARFQNQTTTGWQNFTAGGGENGLRFFWQMMQSFGSWWVDNGSSIGALFEQAMHWLNIFRIAVRDLSTYLFGGGDMNDTVDFLTKLGVPMEGLKTALDTVWTNLKNIFGVSDGTSTMDFLKTRLQAFSTGLLEMMNAFNIALQGISQMMAGYNQLRSASASDWAWYMAGGSVFGDKGANVNAGLNQIFSGIGTTASGAHSVVGGAASTATGMVFGGDSTPFRPTSTSELANQIPLASPTGDGKAVYDVNVNISADSNVSGLVNNPEFRSAVTQEANNAVRNVIMSEAPNSPKS